MAGRPRKYKIDIPNLYFYLDPRTQAVYWQYKHPISGKRYGLGRDEKEAKAVAAEANLEVSKLELKHTLAIQSKANLIAQRTITVSTWLDKYQLIQDERLKTGDIKFNTFKQKKKPIHLLLQAVGMKQLADVNTRDISSILDEYKLVGQQRMAQVVRSVLIDVFKEAQHAGEVPPGYNPALATKQPKRKITRSRLSLDEWKLIFEVAADREKYLQNAMLLAIVTGQRLGDISAMKFSDVWDNHLHVLQEKTSSRLAIPLSIRCDALNITLEEVIAGCRDYAVSPYMVHYFRTTSMAKRGSKVTPNTITTQFSKARDATEISWGERTPATFHEQRSLSERLYRAQGINTQHLLGHKSQQQTDRYNDDRGKDWLTISPNGSEQR
ncbi:phage integrase Arm DNA-binding domain-containing protein [Serratia fonticola]